ncbi:MAG: membrane protein insertion efficiency factor YidD [Proteobacteria bacterium]|nr:membrane protein insertion efficiency factor YidD [Pseudomonadota bacterium]
MRRIALCLLCLLPVDACANPLSVPAELLTQRTASPWKTQRPAGGMLWFYSTFISSIDGDRSSGYPVNSLYARQALQAHGPLWGTLLSVDRLLRDWHEIARPALTIRTNDGRLRYVDPLSRNDTWLRN